MDCIQCQNNISAYIDNELDSSLISHVEQHLKECPHCRKEYDAILDIKKECAGLPDIDLPSNFHNSLREKLKREGKRKVAKKINRKVFAGVAAAILVVFIGVYAAGNIRLGSSKSASDSAAPMAEATSSSYAGKADYDMEEAPAEPQMEMDYAENEENWDEAAEEAGYGSDGFATANRGEAENIEKEEMAKTPREAPQEADAASISDEAERKIIKSAYLGVETIEFDRTVDEIVGRIGAYLGYIESSEVQGAPREMARKITNRKAHFEIRIPKKSFDQFIANMGDLGNVISRQIMGEDITGRYFDTEARVKSLKVQEDRLLTILAKAEILQDIIELERELSRVRYEIEDLTGSLKKWDNMVEYSRITIDVYEVQELKKEEPLPITWGEKILNGFKKSCEQLWKLFENLIVFIVSAIPYLAILALVGWGIWGAIIKPRSEKKIDKEGSKDDEQ